MVMVVMSGIGCDIFGGGAMYCPSSPMFQCRFNTHMHYTATGKKQVVPISFSNNFSLVVSFTSRGDGNSETVGGGYGIGLAH